MKNSKTKTPNSKIRNPKNIYNIQGQHKNNEFTTFMNQTLKEQII